MKTGILVALAALSVVGLGAGVVAAQTITASPASTSGMQSGYGGGMMGGTNGGMMEGGGCGCANYQYCQQYMYDHNYSYGSGGMMG